MKRNIWIPISILALSTSAMAAPPPPTGGAIQQLPPTISPPITEPKLDIQQGKANVIPQYEPGSLKLVVKSMQITGSQAFSEADLIVVADFKPGSALTLTELRAMAMKIEKFYHARGYIVAQAYLPAQDINDGAIRITVAEGHYGKIMVRNQSNVAGGVISGLMDGLSSGDVVTAGTLESHLLLLSDLPGVQISSALVPGATFGTSDLLLDVLPGQRVTASIDADNAGNRYTGAVRVGATLNFNEPTGQGDVASLRLLTSGEGLNYFRASYQMQIGKVRVGAAHSSLEYALGKEFETLLANGSAQVTSFYGNYPLLRSRNASLYAGLSYETKRFQDRLDSVMALTDKTAHVWAASLHGDHRDSFAGGGSNSYALALTSGQISILTPAARAFDAATAHSNGHFGKLGFSASRLQTVTSSISLFARIDGQIASKNLDVSEKMELGGMYAVRAYPEGEAYGDEGVVASVEARLQLPKSSSSAAGEMQVFGFLDAGTIKLDSKPWTAAANRRTLSAAGLGMSWSKPGDYLARVIYAHRLGNELATSGPDSANRLWLQFIKYF